MGSFNQKWYRNKTDGRVLHIGGSMSDEWEQITNKLGESLHREQCRAELRAMLKPGDIVYTQLRHVSSSGMSRGISLHIVQDGRIACIDWLACHAMNDRMHPKGGIHADGCGMDMGFHLVYNLGTALWPKGTDKPHGTRNGQPDTAGGYALKHEWL